MFWMCLQIRNYMWKGGMLDFVDKKGALVKKGGARVAFWPHSTQWDFSFPCYSPWLQTFLLTTATFEILPLLLMWAGVSPFTATFLVCRPFSCPSSTTATYRNPSFADPVCRHLDRTRQVLKLKFTHFVFNDPLLKVWRDTNFKSCICERILLNSCIIHVCSLFCIFEIVIFFCCTLSQIPISK